MQARQGLALAIVGLAAATAAGVWVVQGGNEPAGDTATTSTAPRTLAEDASATKPDVAKETPQLEQIEAEAEPRPEWTPPTTPILIPGTEPRAEEDREGDREQRRADARRRMVEQFDTDGDGELSEAERDAARAAWEARAERGRRMMVERYDTDGDGELNDAERQEARAEFQRVRDEIASRVVPEYDLDGDGELNREERSAAAPAMRMEYQRVMTIARLDLDRSGAIDSTELARAVVGVADGDEEMDLNRDGKVDHEDAAYAAELAQDGG